MLELTWRWGGFRSESSGVSDVHLLKYEYSSQFRMESEGLRCTWIFFKDKKNEIKGPYSERNVQEWYREGWFDSSSPFYFLTEGGEPDDSSSSFTLDELCTRNGIGAPFRLPSDSSSPEKIRAQREQKLCCIEEEIRSLRVKFEGILRVKERIEKMEEKIKSLPLQSLQSTNAAPEAPVSHVEKEEKNIPKADEKLVEQRDKKLEAELSKFNKLAEFYSDLCIAYADSLQTKDFQKIHRDFRDATLEQANFIIEHKEAYSIFSDKTIEKVKKREFFSCSICEFLPYSYKQYFIHLIDPIHVHNENVTFGQSFVQIIQKLVFNIGRMFGMQQDIFVGKVAQKYTSVSLSKSRLKSEIAFAAHITDKYQCKLQMQAQTALANGAAPWKTENEFVMFGIKEVWKGRGVAAELVAELDAHIGTGLTYCLDCKMVTGTREEYYRHLMLYSHLLRKERTHTLYPTMAVNVHRRDLID